ncbi:hypothetical protein [Streptomyces sp. NPDC005507]
MSLPCPVRWAAAIPADADCGDGATGSAVPVSMRTVGTWLLAAKDSSK